MGIFNRKNEEIKELKDRADDLQRQVIDLQKELSEMKQGLADDNERFVKKMDDFEEFFKKSIENRINNVIKEITDVKFSFDEKIDEIDKDKEEIAKLNKKVDLLQEISTKQNELITINQTPAQVAPTTGGKKHLFEMNGSFASPYKEIKLHGDTLMSYKRKFSFTIEDVIDIKENLQKYYEEGLSVRAIGKLHGITSDSIYKLVWNIEEGYFDKVIDEYMVLISEYDENKINHLRTVSKAQQRDLNKENISYDSDGNLFSSGRRLHYTIDNIKELKKRIPDFEKYPTNRDLLNDMGIGDFGGAVLIWRIEEGYFDEIIDEYDKVNEGIEENWHIFKLKKSYHKPYTDLVVGHGGVLYSSNNQKLSFTLQDVIMLRDKIYSNKYTNLSDLREGFDFSRQMFNKLVWNIEEGYFDDLIEEYNSRNYTYENIMNNLYIDGENTGLTIEKCNLIIDCIINENNKQECVNKLIKTYSETKPKYIRILSEEYANPNLSKVLRKEVRKIEKIDNPQKRRELGIY